MHKDETSSRKAASRNAAPIGLPPKDPEALKQWFVEKVHRKNRKEKPLKITSCRLSQPKIEGSVETSVDEENDLSLRLTETSNIWLLTVISCLSQEDPEEVSKVISDNEAYSKVINADSEIGKVHNAETQTWTVSKKIKSCETVDVKVAHSFVNASAWDLYDTYAQVGTEEGFGIAEFQMLIDTALKTRGVAQTEGILAVGYGQINFEEEAQGCVCIWSRKNPSHPERKYNFKESVTTLCFSSLRPHLLAVGCRNGDILLIDISANKHNIRHFASGFGPVWKAEWFTHHKVVAEEEELMTLGESGLLKLYSFNEENASKEIMRLDYTTSCGEYASGAAKPKKVFSSKTLSGLWFSLVPLEYICYISTKEGIIVKVIFRPPCYIERRMNAHLGPVYTIQHSPATPLILLTCGADHCLRIWADGIEDPLITLASAMKKTAVCAQWSPTIPTLIATLSTVELAVWDIARKTKEPMSLLKIRSTDPPFSTLRFSTDGSGLVVGDQHGLLKVMQLAELPRPPFLQVEALSAALDNAILDNSELSHKFKKFVRINKEKFVTIIS